MEKKVVRIFYLGIAQGEFFTGGKRQKREGLPVRILDDRPEFPGGYLEIAYALLPEYAGKCFFTGRGRKWKTKIKRRILLRTLKNAEQMSEHRECVIHRDLKQVFVTGQKPEEDAEGSCSVEELPRELMAAHLHSKALFDSVCVFFSEDGGTYEAREVILLLSPYLRKMRQVMVIGEDGVTMELFSDYLYYEYGLVPDRCSRMPLKRGAGGADKKEILRKCNVSRKAVCLDLSGRAIPEGEYMGILEETWCINPRETLKFLDTTIKNGYNTES